MLEIFFPKKLFLSNLLMLVVFTLILITNCNKFSEFFLLNNGATITLESSIFAFHWSLH